MPNILYINSALNFGATGRIVEQTGLLAQQFGFNCFVLHSVRYGRKSQLKNDSIGDLRSEKLHALYSFLFDKHGLGSKNETIRAIEKIKAFKPDIIHLHNIHGYYINYRYLFDIIQTLDIPIVWTLHDCWPFTGHCTYFDYINCDKWKEKCCNCPQKNRYPRSLIDRSSVNYEFKKELFSSINNLTLVPVSNWLGDLLKSSFLKDKPIRVIHNGIDLDVFKPTPSKLREKLNLKDKFIILGVANHFGRRKGFEDFVFLSNSLKDLNFKVILVGASDKEIKSAPSEMIVKGRTESVQELVEFYSMADVFVNATYEDNFPTTNLESLASGTPVITYNTGGSPESIDEFTGVVVPKGNRDALLSSIKSVMKKGKQYYSDNCRKRALMNFDKQSRFQSYIDLYEDLLCK